MTDDDFLILDDGVVDMRRVRLVGTRLAVEYALGCNDPDELDRARTAALNEVGEHEFALVVDHALTIMALHVVRPILDQADRKGWNLRKSLTAQLEQLRS